MTALAVATRPRFIAAAVAAILVATAVRYLFDPILGDRIPYAPFFLAMLVTAWYGDWVVAAGSLLVGAFLATALFVSRQHSLLMLTSGDTLRLAGYFTVGIASIAVSESLRRAGQREAARSTQLLTQQHLLQESEHRFRTMADAMPQIAWAARPDGYLDYYNQRWYEFTGFEEGQAGDESWMPILHPDDVDRCHKRWYESVRSGDVYEVEYRLRDRCGQFRWHLGRALPVRDMSGRIVRWFGTCTDIHDQKQASERLKEADRAKGEFLANISHELRTPMNAIIGMTDLALSEDLAPPVRDFLSTARGSADVLLGLLNEILDFSRLESGKLVMESVPFGLRSTLDETIKTLAVKACEKGLELACDLPDDVPDEFVGDPLRLKQVLLNLIGNAVKFTERGEIVLRLSVESKSSGEVCLRFAICDTGIGISPEDQQRIFTPFTQADASTTRHYGGAGLGLAISSELVRMMGGRLWVESQFGQGSTFYFTARLLLDAAPPPRAKPLAQAVEKLRDMPKLQILVAEDTPANQKLIQSLLIRRGHYVEIAHNGREAVDLVRQHEFDLVIMDVQMPIMDGFQATAAIRGRENPRQRRLPILAMTAHAMRGDRQRCLAAGMDAYLAKPIDGRRLLELIESLSSEKVLEMDARSDNARQAREPAAGIVDLDAALERMGGDRQLLEDIVQFYFQDSPGLLLQIEQAICAQDSSQLERAAHSLKGLASNFGAGTVVETTARLECFGRSSQFDQATALMESLHARIAELNRELNGQFKTSDNTGS